MKFKSINLLATFILPCLLTLTSSPAQAEVTNSIAQGLPTNGPGGTTRGPNGEYFPTGGTVQPMPPPTRGPNGEYFPSRTTGVDPNHNLPTQGLGGTTRGPNGEYFPGPGPSGPSRSGNNIDWNELTKASSNPIVFLVNGFGGCAPCIAPYLHDKLKAQGIPVYDLDWNDINRRKQSTDFNLSDANFLQQMDSVISKINPSRPIVLIGHSFGGDSVLKVAQRVAPRKIAFLGVLDAVELGGIRTGRSVGSNVRYFYNRWTKNPSEFQPIKGIPIGRIPGIPYNVGIPTNAGISGSVSCSASTCDDQREQSFGYEENGKARRQECGSFEVTCTGYNPVPKRFGGSNGTKHLRITHGGTHAIYGDPYIQQQIFTIIMEQVDGKFESVSVRGTIPQKRPDKISNAYNLSGPAVASLGVPAKYVFPMGNKIVVVNTQGEVWAHDVGSSIGQAYNIPGPAVASLGVPAKYVFPMGNKIVVVNTQGEVWAHDVGSSIGQAYNLPGPAVATAGLPAKYVFPIGNKIVVVNSQGEVWAHDVGSSIGQAYNLPGPAVATAGLPAKYVFPIGNKIVVVNSQGEVWAHDVGSSIGQAYNLPGPAVATAGLPAKYVFPIGNKIVVVNSQGEVWAHDVGN